MTNKKEVLTSVGLFEVIKPKAGKRNRAVMASETSTGHIKQSTFLITLLPQCINSRPESFDKDVDISHVLNDLETEDYDLLTEALLDLLENKTDTTEEKKT